MKVITNALGVTWAYESPVHDNMWCVGRSADGIVYVNNKCIGRRLRLRHFNYKYIETIISKDNDIIYMIRER